MYTENGDVRVNLLTCFEPEINVTVGATFIYLHCGPRDSFEDTISPCT